MPRGRGYSSAPRSYRGSSSSYRGSSGNYRGSSSSYRGSSSSYRGSSSSYRGRSSRGHSSFNGGSSRGYSDSSRRNSFSSSMDSRRGYDSRPPKYSSSERLSRSDEYKSYRSDYGSLSRDRRSPEHKRLRVEAPSSRHESYYGSSRHEPPPPPSYSDRRLSSERHQSSPISRREEFRRPMGPPSKRGSSYRGRISSRGSRGLRFTERPIRRRLVESSYVIRKRFIPRVPDYSRRLKITRLRSAIVRRGVKRSLKDSDDDEKSKDGDSKDKEDRSEKEDDKKSIDENEGGEKKKSKAFIKLVCPHCGLRALTFRKYEIHLRTRSHLIAMRRVALKQKAILAQMRQAQRNTQNELEKNTSSDDLGNRTNFCPLCKLNYKQKKAVHQLSESHKNMKKFLMPFCKVCNISFKSPMIYENHCCSVDHIKRKQRMDNSSEASGEDDNLENFTTIDSVGDVDEETEAEEKKEDDKEPPVNVGIEKIRKIEAFYCDLCKMYLQRGDEAEVPKILTRHCKQRVHMQRYVRLKETEELEKRAEKLQRKDLADKEAKEKKSLGEGDSKDKTKLEDEESKDDKLWADVDKDLGDILAEAETGKSSDEDEDSHVNGERYDRFKLSEKNGEEKLMGTDEEGILDNKLVIKEDDKKK